MRTIVFELGIILDRYRDSGIDVPGNLGNQHRSFLLHQNVDLLTKQNVFRNVVVEVAYRMGTIIYGSKRIIEIYCCLNV